MTGHDRAHACSVRLDADDSSVCLGGTSFSDVAAACAPGHTGVLCGACEEVYARDHAKKECKPCSELPDDWRLILRILAEPALHAAWGTFVAVRAMSVASGTDAVLIRMGMQWVTLSSMLAFFSLDHIEVFEWSKDETEAEEASFSVHFPAWFTGIHSTVLGIFSQTSYMSSAQQDLECLVVRNLSSERAKHIVPLVWWLIFPVTTIAFLAAELFILTKLLYPIWHRAKKRRASEVRAPQLESQETTELDLFGDAGGKSCCLLCRQVLPLVLVCLYTIWPKYTIRFFQVLQSEYVFIDSVVESASSCSSGMPASQVVLLSDTRLRFLSGDHLVLGLLAMVGLAIWSFGLLLGLHLVVARLRKQMQVHHTIRMVGFFFRGLKPQWYWWELLVKRGEVLLVYGVLYLPIASDDKAKLLLCATIAGIALVMQLATKPYDDRRGHLFDNMETGGILVRILTLVAVLLVIFFNASNATAVVVAATVLVLNIAFILTMVALIVSEIAYSADRTLAKQLVSKSRVSAVRAHATRAAAAVLRLAALVNSERCFLEERTQRFRWSGSREPIALVEPVSDSDVSGARLLVRRLARHFFSLTVRKQRRRAGEAIGQMFEHLFAAGLQYLPPAALDFTCVLPIALRRLDAAHPVSFQQLHFVIAEVEAIVRESKQVASDKVPCTVSAEEMCRGLEHLRQMMLADVTALFQAFLAVLAESPPRPSLFDAFVAGMSVTHGPQKRLAQ
eukprot:NODE_98_length_3700_cov_3.103834.p1 GENE.NODE_98_length_3700_cov_3.103834~~NODE_98_length_3700_cov_3.103834.p1  ORF type:complete len:733 (+),score=204.77 NODE_98_length_3700_cov_3.103834:1283-3481(+)